MSEKSWYQLQWRPKNRTSFENFDAPIPVDKPGALDTAMGDYNDAVKTWPDDDWRLITVTEKVISSTEVVVSTVE